MIKAYHNITLKDVILLDATKSASHLKKYWFVPIWFCHKELEKLAKQIFESIGDSSVDDLENDFEKLISYRNLQILEALYKAVKIELNLKTRINVWKLIMEKDIKESNQLNDVLAEVLKHTGIDIKSQKDLTDFEDYVQFRIDKHKEMFPEKTVEEIETERKNSKSPIEIIYSYFNYLGEDFNENMRLIVFVGAIKKIAEERIRKSNIQSDGEQSGNSTD